MTSRVWHGSLIHAPSPRELQYLRSSLISVSSDGLIEWVVPSVAADGIAAVLEAQGSAVDARDVVRLRKGQFFMPGLVDTHTHAPQHPNIGTGGQYQLLDWLNNVTFPREAKFADVDYARRIYPAVVRRTLGLGTTTSCYYASLHLESSKVLAETANEQGQRAFVGKCNMDSNCPSTYVEESCAASLADTAALIAFIRALTPSPSTALVQPILTPRFAISCSPDLLEGLGQLAADEKARGNEVAIQTHLGENLGEIAFTKELFSRIHDWDGTYAGVYERYGLLGPRTVLAHCVHLEEEELQLIKRTSSGVSHCPTSNFNLRSGIAKVADMLDREIKVGLGTDCSGGYEMGILSQMRTAILGSKAIKFGQQSAPDDDGSFAGATHLPLSAVFHMATLGGASLVGLDSVVGSFEAGKEWDAVLVDVGSGRGVPGIWFDEDDESDEGWEESAFERFVYNGDDRNIATVWVRGRAVAGQDHRPLPS